MWGGVASGPVKHIQREAAEWGTSRNRSVKCSVNAPVNQTDTCLSRLCLYTHAWEQRQINYCSVRKHQDKMTWPRCDSLFSLASALPSYLCSFKLLSRWTTREKLMVDSNILGMEKKTTALFCPLSLLSHEIISVSVKENLWFRMMMWNETQLNTFSFSQCFSTGCKGSLDNSWAVMKVLILLRIISLVSCLHSLWHSGHVLCRSVAWKSQKLQPCWGFITSLTRKVERNEKLYISSVELCSHLLLKKKKTVGND